MKIEIEDEKVNLNEYRDRQDLNKDKLKLAKSTEKEDLINNINTI